jgi:hypothetical protein
MNEERRVQGQVGTGFFGGAEIFANKVKVTKSDGWIGIEVCCGERVWW